jgi:hypothetical protein
MGFESASNMKTKEFCGAARPSKLLKGKQGTSSSLSFTWCARINLAMSAQILIGGSAQESLQSGAFQADGALYANLAKTLFARFYGKLLIPRLGT